MEIFELILVLFVLIVISNIFGKIFNSFSIPLIQLILGFLSAIYIPHFNEINIEPRMFLSIFIAPLLFYEAKMINKRQFWKNKNKIILLAIALVVFTVIILGSIVNFIIPSISLSIAFALAASLTPTDPISIAAIQEKINISSKVLTLLNGEALINDASGIVAFQFSLLAIMTGSFSIYKIPISFIWMSVIGIIIGVLFSLIKIKIFRILEDKKFNNPTLFVLTELIIPFTVYIICEKVGVDGILGVVAAGLVHILERNNSFNPKSAQLNITINNIWEILSFTLNGMVFILTGIHLHKIFQNTIGSNIFFIIKNLTLAFFIVSIIYIVRFIFSVFILWNTNNIKNKKFHFITTVKEAIIMSLSGIKGAVTLATVLSIPFFIHNTKPFPYRDSMLLIASFIIIITILVANFILPLISKTDKTQLKNNYIKNLTIEIEIIQTVIKKLNYELENDHNKLTNIKRFASKSVINGYFIRLNKLKNDLLIKRFKNSSLLFKINEWKKIEILHLVKNKKISYSFAKEYMKKDKENTILFSKHNAIKHKKNNEFIKSEKSFYNELKKLKKKNIRSYYSKIIRIFRFIDLKENINKRSYRIQNQWGTIHFEVSKYILQRLQLLEKSCKIDLKKINTTKISSGSDVNNIDFEELKILIDNYKIILSTIKTLMKDDNKANIVFRTFNKKGVSRSIITSKNLTEYNHQYQNFSIIGFRFERQEIQSKFNNGNITSNVLHDLRQQVNIMEFSLKNAK